MSKHKELQLENERLRARHEKTCVTLEEERARLRETAARLRSLTEEREQLLDQVMDKTAQAEAAEARSEALHEYHITTLQNERERGEAEARRIARDGEREQRRLMGELQALTERQAAWHQEREHLRDQLRAQSAAEAQLREELAALQESLGHEKRLTRTLQDQVSCPVPALASTA